MSVNDVIMDALVANNVGYVTTVPCKQLAGVIEKIEASSDMIHVPANREDEGMGLCAGALWAASALHYHAEHGYWRDDQRIGHLIQFYRMPLPMLISYRGEVGEPVACQVEMAVHTKALLAQLNIPTYHFHKPEDADELSDILSYAYMGRKPVAILMDATFWKGQ